MTQTYMIKESFKKNIPSPPLKNIYTILNELV